MVQIILDTNFLITCIKQKIYFEEQIKELIPGAEITVPTQVKNELRKIAGDKGRKYKVEDREAASLALQITENMKIINLNGKYADRGIINYCEKNSADSADKSSKIYVATIDEELIRKLKEQEKVGIIRIRGKKRLVVE